MVGAAPHPVLSTLLRHLPARVLALLDKWSYSVARRRAERRRQGVLRRQARQG